MIEWKWNNHNFAAYEDGEYVGLVSMAPPETCGASSWNAAFHVRDGGLIGLGPFGSPEQAKAALELAANLGWTYGIWDRFKGHDRYGERVMIGDTVEVLDMWDVNVVVKEAVVVGYDPWPEYARDDLGYYLWDEMGLSASIWRGQIRYKSYPQFQELPTWLHFAEANARMGLQHFKEAYRYRLWMFAAWGITRFRLAAREAFWHFEQSLAIVTMILAIVALVAWGS
jgi:hypothetical protein